jgi:hypothetical protein
LRQRKGGKLGGHAKHEWVPFDKMTKEEQIRTRRYMYDSNESLFVDSWIHRMCLQDWVSDAVHSSWLRDLHGDVCEENTKTMTAWKG